MLRRSFAFLSLTLAASMGAHAQHSRLPARRDRDSLFAILGRSPGHDYKDEVPVPLGPVKLRLPQGEEIHTQIAAWSLVGDLHFQFVFDTGRSLSFAQPSELRGLQLATLGDALNLSISNVWRVSAPRRSKWKAGIAQIHGGVPQLNSGYFLDRNFWQSLQEEHACPLAVAVPTSKTVLYAPVNQSDDVRLLQEQARETFSAVSREGISPLTFQFSSGSWSVLPTAQ